MHVFLLALVLAFGVVGMLPADTVNFDRDIRPILSDNCFLCHGPDADSRQADLRLDTRAGIFDSVVIAGKPHESELVSRVFDSDDAVRMPPPESKRALTQSQKQLLKKWVAEGAPYLEHWSFQSLPGNVPIPSVREASWPRGELDRLVLARLEAGGIHPSAPTDSLRLLRRISLDLAGLPPSESEIADFERAAAKDLDRAIEAQVQRLLNSPSFGEHMAVAWLDAARYADSFGYQSDQLNTQWPYRDWVVRAFNSNMPYDQFVTWQLAGDLIRPPTRDAILATAFNRLHRMTNEGGSIAEEWLVENAADRVHTFGTAILGLTLECARCHDHKYDPISSRDYYSLFAFFNSIDENGMYDHALKVPAPSLLLPTEDQSTALAKAVHAVRAAKQTLAAVRKNGGKRYEAWLASAIANPKTAQTADTDLIAEFSFDQDLANLPNQVPNSSIVGKSSSLSHVDGVSGNAVRFDGDHGVVFSDLLPIDRWDDFTVDLWLQDTVENPLPVVVLHRSYGTDVGYNGFDVLLHGGLLDVRLFRVWPGNAIGVRTKKALGRDQWQHVTITYDGSSSARGLLAYLNGERLPTEILRDHIYKRASVATYGTGEFTLGERFRDRGFHQGQIDELRVFARALTPLEVRGLHDETAIDHALAAVAEQDQHLREYYFAAVDEAARAANDELHKARQKFVEAEDLIQEVAVMRELPEPRPAYVLARGAYDAPKSDANRTERDVFREILIPFPADAPRNRLGLAHWLTDPNHPLTARVFVNRIWSNFFGRGLVATPENFGRQGESPSHPELLDWLARDFIDHGWDVKRLCRQIVLSATYQQDSKVSKGLHDKDPDNRLLARGPSHRLTGEQIRDLALGASGLLRPTVGGPPVSPYQPGEDLWRESNTMSPPYRQSVGEDLYRRSLYSVWKRTAPLPNMSSFDVPSREVCVVARSRTNTPLQSLILLNDRQFVECAQSLARDVIGGETDHGTWIRRAFLRLAGREPDELEQAELLRLLESQRESFLRSTENDAARLLGVEQTTHSNDDNLIDWAALTIVCQTIANLDATLYKR